VGFLGSWLFIRTSARMIRAQVSWWPGNVETGSGLHIHHLVWGICLMIGTGFLGFALQPYSPYEEILAVLFGIGMGLTLDEFALWLHLEDVYWTDEGRSSVDAVVVALIFGLMVMVGLSPAADVEDNEGSTALIVLAVATHVAPCVLTMLKGKLLTGFIGLGIPFVGLVGMLRLAKPHSPWARRFYKEGSRRLKRSRERYARVERRRRRLMDAVAGAPSDPDPETPSQAPK
jgi:lysyl-tRNA synthetase, class II